MSTRRDKFFQMRVDEHFLKRLDNLRRREPDLPSRTEMARRLIEGAFARSEVDVSLPENTLYSGREKRRRSPNVGSARPKQRPHAS
jgi:hypothetical protein